MNSTDIINIFKLDIVYNIIISYLDDVDFFKLVRKQDLNFHNRVCEYDTFIMSFIDINYQLLDTNLFIYENVINYLIDNYYPNIFKYYLEKKNLINFCNMKQRKKLLRLYGHKYIYDYLDNPINFNYKYNINNINSYYIQLYFDKHINNKLIQDSFIEKYDKELLFSLSINNTEKLYYLIRNNILLVLDLNLELKNNLVTYQKNYILNYDIKDTIIGLLINKNMFCNFNHLSNIKCDNKIINTIIMAETGKNNKTIILSLLYNYMYRYNKIINNIGTYYGEKIHTIKIINDLIKHKNTLQFGHIVFKNFSNILDKLNNYNLIDILNRLLNMPFKFFIQYSANKNDLFLFERDRLITILNSFNITNVNIIKNIAHLYTCLNIKITSIYLLKNIQHFSDLTIYLININEYLKIDFSNLPLEWKNIYQLKLQNFLKNA